jgi:hypothetical protein
VLYFIILVTDYMFFYLKNPLSYFPHRGKDDLAPSPVGEVPIAIGREGGKLTKHKCKLNINKAIMTLLPLL